MVHPLVGKGLLVSKLLEVLAVVDWFNIGEVPACPLQCCDWSRFVEI